MVIDCCFAGRKDRMEVQLKYMIELLNQNIIDRYDIYNFAWSEEDSKFIDGLKALHPNIHIRHAIQHETSTKAKRGNQTATSQLGFFYSMAYDPQEHKDDIFIKLDDDVVWIDTNKVKDFISIRQSNPDPFLISADVINKKVTDSKLKAIKKNTSHFLKI